MNTVTVEQLLHVMPAAGEKAALYEPFINQGAVEFGIAVTVPRMQAFLAELAVESDDLQKMSENLNYSPEGLASTWPNRYAIPDGEGGYVKATIKGKVRNKPNETAIRLAKAGPEAIANHCYANRMGNGDEASGDGWRNRGSGGFELTGAANMARCAKHFGISMDEIGEWLRSPEGAMRSACWFFWQAGCSKPADEGNFDAVSDLVNIGRKTEKYGDAIGFDKRLKKFQLAKEALCLPA